MNSQNAIELMPQRDIFARAEVEAIVYRSREILRMALHDQHMLDMLSSNVEGIIRLICQAAQLGSAGRPDLMHQQLDAYGPKLTEAAKRLKDARIKLGATDDELMPMLVTISNIEDALTAANRNDGGAALRELLGDNPLAVTFQVDLGGRPSEENEKFALLRNHALALKREGKTHLQISYELENRFADDLKNNSNPQIDDVKFEALQWLKYDKRQRNPKTADRRKNDIKKLLRNA